MRIEAPRGHLKASLKIATLNIQGGGSLATAQKWTHINQIMRTRKIGIMAIQETHLTDCATRDLNKQFRDQIHILNSGHPGNASNTAGIAVVINCRLVCWKRAKMKVLIPGRAILVQVPWHDTDQTLDILAVYAPNRDDENTDFWSKIKTHRNNLPKPNVMMGDMNMVEEAADRLPSKPNAESKVNAMRSLKRKLDLIDRWRNEHPSELQSESRK
ncbi:Endonuclease/exonuclease/phosphatase [Coprinopsis sp. MPI-PUGE-AT-0042]|nr:Endonuclease/exonuclease/phosphatase [Coprinopsis sp. MPI-PUGE-AT-0042]